MMPLEAPESPQPGLAVVSSDGARLGTVKETSGSYFKIDAPLHRDYWLSGQLVKSRHDAGIVLDIARNEIAEHRLPEPGLEPGEDAFERVAGHVVLSEEELLEQRARMERELAERSRNLPPHEPSVTQMRGPRAFERIPVDHSGFRDLAGGYVPNAPVHDRMNEMEKRKRVPRRTGMMASAAFLVTAGIAVVAFIAYRRRASGHSRRARDRAIEAAHGAAERAHSASHILAARAHAASHRIADRTAVAAHDTADSLPPRRELPHIAARRAASFAGRVQKALERAA